MHRCIGLPHSDGCVDHRADRVGGRPMTHSAAERTSSRDIPPQSRMNLPPNVALRGQQLTLIDMSGGAGHDGLDLPERIAALERELRYYRRVIPVLARASVKPRG